MRLTDHGNGFGENWPQNFCIWACSRVPWKAATTTMVLASTVDIQVVEVTPSKSRLVYSTGEGPWRANEHEGEGETEGQGVQTGSPPSRVSWAGYVAPTPPCWRARSSPVGPRPCLPPAHQSGCPTPPQPGWTWTPQCTGFCLLGMQLWSPHPTKAKGTAKTPVLRSGASSLRSHFLLAHPETNEDLLLPSCMEPGAPGG